MSGTVFQADDVSVIIPSYNRPSYLVRAVKSVSNQSKLPSEIIVINDGSDVSYSKPEAFLDEIPIKNTYIKINNSGASTARNIGAENATGEIFMFLDDDDRWKKDKIKNQIGYINQNVGLVYSGRVVVNEEGDELFNISGKTVGDISDEILIHNPIGTTSGPAIRSSVFNRIGGFDENLPGLQDWDLWIRACQETLVGYDHSYTIEWTHHDGDDQMTSDPERYLESINQIKTKYSDKYSKLSFVKNRKAKAHQNKAIGKKYAQINSNKKYIYILRSLYQWPSVAAAARLLPNTLLNNVRK